MALKREIGLFTAILIIIADVIGTGIFMTTGNVLGMTGDAFLVMVLWGVGAVVAITGSLCYAELASIWPDNGGEYIYLKKIYGSLPSFLTGWISLVVGFTASASIAAILVLWYLNEFFQSGILSDPWVQKITASAIVVFFGITHLAGVRRGSIIQNSLTILKLLIVVSLIIFGFYAAGFENAGNLTMKYAISGNRSILNSGSALLVIMYAYSGWNGAAYIAGEIKDPGKNLPKAMFFGTLSIGVIYLLLNAVFLMSSPGTELIGKNAVGAIAAKNLFGPGFAPVYTIGIAILLLSSVSVQMMVGPRVYYAMARDRMIFQSLSRVHPRFNTPDLAIVIQVILTVIYVFMGMNNVISLLIYLGFSLGIFPLMSVIGLMIIRYRRKDITGEFRVPFFPVIPMIYILLTLSMMVTSLITSTKSSLIALVVVFSGIIVYLIWQKYINRDQTD